MGKWRTQKWGRRKKRFQGLVQVAVLLAASVTFVTVCLLFKRDPLDPPRHYRVHATRQLLQSTDYILEDESSTETPAESNETKSAPLFPPDLFTPDQHRKGAIILHVLGMVYMFVALAIVCDEFFVPSLDVIIEKLEISQDVAGATFMAAGGSAPELFTSVIGVFISFDDVGIGTIVGSAVFNILFVIAMCVLFSKTVLDLTWWPIFRDCTFYSIALIMMVAFFLDSKIYWFEALSLLSVYVAYCGFMKINHPFERFVKRHLNKNKVTRVCSTDQLVPNHGGALAAAAPLGAGGRRPSIPMLHSGTKFRQGLLQLMIHTIDPLHDGKVDEKATQLHAIASLKVLLDATKPQNGRVETYKSDGLSANDGRPDAQSHLSGRSSQGTAVTHLDSVISAESQQLAGGVGTGFPPTSNGDLQSESSMGNNVSYDNAMVAGDEAQGGLHEGIAVDPSLSDIPEVNIEPNDGMTTDPGEDDEEEIKPIDLSWPDTCRKRIIYICVMPLIIPMWLTMPDTRTPRGKRFFPITFFGSICWIAIFSYMMVWWATIVGNTIEIPPEIMGLTILAAGTSVPDLITSVIVARKGFGDMAVSSSIGSNIFDVCVGLPVPWLLFALKEVIKNFINDVPNPWEIEPITVGAAGMACSIMLLFSMLMFVLISIMCSRWKMNKGLGISMFFLYFVFLAVSLSFENDIIPCPGKG